MRISRHISITILSLLGTSVWGQSVYCPQNSGFINVGMTQDQVLSACGQPQDKRQSDTPATVKVPVKQLIYTALNTGSVYPGLNSAFYDQWSMPSGSTGISLEISVIDQKVYNVKINGSGSNAVSLCGGTSIQVGDNVSDVYTACGSPSMVNSTFIDQPIPSKSNPEIWIYKIDSYHPAISLTFVNGKLQSIN